MNEGINGAHSSVFKTPLIVAYPVFLPILLLLNLFLLLGCSATQEDLEPSDANTSTESQVAENEDHQESKSVKLKEIPTTDIKTTSDASEAELAYRARKYFETGVYSEARQALQSLISNYPLGAYADFAEIKLADTSFETGDYTAAAQQYEEFYKNHPASEASAYILFKTARSNHLAHKGLGRDVATLEKACKFYDDLRNKFPKSPYTYAANKYSNEAHAGLNAYEESVAEFYKRRDKTQASEARLVALSSRSINNTTGSNTGKASNSEARASLTALAKQLPPIANNTPSVAEAPSIKERAGVMSSNQNTDKLSGSSVTVLRAECSQKELTQLSLFLNRDLPEDLPPLGVDKVHSTVDGLSIKLPVSTGAIGALESSCKDGTILKLSKDGVLSTSQGKEASLISISNPPRLLVLLR